MIFENVRTETMNRGDMNAMLAACQLGRERFLRLVQRYGADVVMSAAYEWMDYSERMLRAEIAKIPDGEYKAPTGWLDDDARNRDVPLRVETKVIVEGDEITIDLTGSNPEVPTGLQRPLRGLAARLLLLRGPDDPARRGHVPGARAAERRRLPAGEGDRAQGDDLQPELPARVLLALLPDAARRRQHDPRARRRAAGAGVTAGNSAGIHFCAYSGFLEESGEYWLYLEVNEGSYGGRHGKDAMDSVDNLMANTRNNPIEELDMRFPMRCDQYELRPEPAAPGKWRGGIGIVRRNRFLVDGMYSCEGDRQYDPPRGHLRRLGRPRRVVSQEPRHRAARRTCRPRSPASRSPPGEFIEFREPNAAGYGDPLERDPELVREDVLDDFTTIELARDAYGVVFRTSAPSRSTRRRRRRCGRSSRRPEDVSSLTGLLRGRELPPSSSPSALAGNREFGLG